MKIVLPILVAWSLALMTVAQEPVPAPAAEIRSEVVSPDHFSALALVPQDAEAFCVLAPSAMLGQGTAALSQDAPVADDVESAALALGAGSEGALRGLLPVLHAAESQSTDGQMAEQWLSAAHELPARIICDQFAQHAKEDADVAIAALEQWHPAPLYVVVTLRPEAAEKAAELQHRLSEMLRQCDNAEPLSAVEWQGVRLHLPADMADMPELTLLQRARLRAALERMPLCLVSTVRERSLIICLCADPSEAQPAVSPVSSVLATEKAQFLVAQPRALSAAGYISPALQNLRRDAHLQGLRSLSGLATGVFKTLMVEDAPAAEVYRHAVEAIASLSTQTERLFATADSPATFAMWREENRLCADVSADACGRRYRAVGGTALPEEAERIVLYESDPMEGACRPDGAAVLNACETLIEGVAETLNNDSREAVQSALMQYRLFREEQAVLGAAIESFAKGTSGKWILAADGLGKVPASLLGGSPAHLVPVPRVAAWVGVQSQADLETAWNQVTDASARICRKLGADPSSLQELPLTHAQEGKAMLTSLALPMCCPAFSPSFVRAEQCFVLSSSAELGVALAQLPPAPAAAEGSARFCFRLSPLATLLTAMAAEDDRLTEQAAAARHAASLVREISARLTTTGDDVLHVHLEIELQP